MMKNLLLNHIWLFYWLLHLMSSLIVTFWYLKHFCHFCKVYYLNTFSTVFHIFMLVTFRCLKLIVLQKYYLTIFDFYCLLAFSLKTLLFATFVTFDSKILHVTKRFSWLSLGLILSHSWMSLAIGESLDGMQSYLHRHSFRTLKYQFIHCSTYVYI